MKKLNDGLDLDAHTFIQCNTGEDRVHRYRCWGAGSFSIEGRWWEISLLITSILSRWNKKQYHQFKEKEKSIDYKNNDLGEKDMAALHGGCVCTRQSSGIQSEICQCAHMFFTSHIFNFDASEGKLPNGRHIWFLLATEQCLVQSMH